MTGMAAESLATRHYLRTPDGAVYGPADIATLCTWSTDARIIPGCELSPDRTTWVSVEAFPALRLNWSVQFDDGTSYGPLNLLAIWALACENSIPRGVALKEKDSKRTVILNDSLYPLLIDECRLVLAACGSLMADASANMAETLQAAATRHQVQDQLSQELRQKLGKAESDLAVNLKLTAETQKRLVEMEAGGSRSVEALAHLDSRVAELQQALATAREETARLAVALTSSKESCGSLEEQLRNAGQQVKTAEERSQTAHQELAAYQEGARREMESLKAVMESAAQAQAVKHEEAIKQITSECDALQRQCRERQAAMEERDRRIQERETELASLKTEAESRMGQLRARLAEVEAALAGEQVRWRKESEALEAMRTEMAAVSGHVQDLQKLLEQKDEQTRRLESELATRRAEAERQTDLLGARTLALEHDLKVARQGAETLKEQLAQACDSLAKAQLANQTTEQQLRAEIVALQGDLNRFALTTRMVEEIASKPRPARIDWMGDDESHEEELATVDPGFVKLSLPEKIKFLHQELQDSARQKESLRREVVALKQRCETLQDESRRKEGEAEEKLAQIRKEVETSTELLNRTLQEVEKREGLLRELRKKSGGNVANDSAKAPVLEAEVIHMEVLGPDEPVSAESAGATTGSSYEGKSDDMRDSPKGKILNSVEAQLQQELRKWESLKNDKAKTSRTMGKWFRRK